MTQDSIATGVLLSIAFASLIFGFLLWRSARAEQKQAEKVRTLVAQALASKGWCINKEHIVLRQKPNKGIDWTISHLGYMFAYGEYSPNEIVHVQLYPRNDDEAEWSFTYSAPG